MAAILASRAASWDCARASIHFNSAAEGSACRSAINGTAKTMPLLYESGKDVGDFEDGAVLNGGGIGPKTRKIVRREQLACRRNDAPEIRNHDSHLFFADPVSIETLLRERPGISLDNDGEFHRQRLADAARPR